VNILEYSPLSKMLMHYSMLFIFLFILPEHSVH